MDKILQALQEVTTAIAVFRGAVTAALKEVADGREELVKGKLAQDARSEGLDVRETEIKKVEDIITLKEEGQRLLNEANAAAKDLEEKQKVFNDNAAAKTKELAAQAFKNEKKCQDNEREAKALVSEREKLEEDKANYKKKIAEALVHTADRL